MRIEITRDSVCAADDLDPEANSRRFRIPNDVSVERLITEVCNAADLPRITGGKATWCVASKIPLAVVAQQWPAPRLLNFIPPELHELDVADDTARFHVSYLAQQDPEIVYDILGRLKLRSY